VSGTTVILGSGKRMAPGAGPRLSVVVIAGLGLLLSGCVPAVASPPATRDIPVTISGMRFVPDHFEVRVGETIRFVVTNPTKVGHELFIGEMAEQLAHHREVMNQSPSEQVQAMQHTGYGIYLDPEGRGELTYHFSTAGQIMIGCHVHGHWEAGMLATITVDPASAP
jgi:uncharacterized cupredoxin-like copper-binding protein